MIKKIKGIVILVFFGLFYFIAIGCAHFTLEVYKKKKLKESLTYWQLEKDKKDNLISAY